MQAAAYLKKKGYRILEANFRCRFGEIDLIARDGAYLVFIEVKYRSSLKDGDSLEAVNRGNREKSSGWQSIISACIRRKQICPAGLM